MRVELIFHGHLRERAGAPSATLALPDGATLADALSAAEATYGPALGELIFDRRRENETRANLTILLADRALGRSALSEALRDGDEVSLFGPIAGG